MADQQDLREKDDVTGTATTGHDWDGIKELDTPLPRWWLWTLYATIVWAFIYMLFYPAYPLISSATTGILGYTNRGNVAEELAAAKEDQSGLLEGIQNASLDEIRAEPALSQFAVAGGRSAFLVNCVQCHGSGAAGYPGYPNLNDDDWLWGGSLEEIHYTLEHGIRYEQNDDTRWSQMPSFGADGLLERAEIAEVADYILAWSDRADATANGEELYLDNCSACHAEDGSGEPSMGAPALNDAIWLYGGDRETVIASITNARFGVMPGWNQRLDEATIKKLTIYVHALGGGEASVE